MEASSGIAVEADDMRKVRVWDLPTRLFHWTLALCALGLVATAKIGGDALMAWHGRLGYAVGTLLLFRLAWGVVGGHWSRFRTFTHSPRTIADHLRGRTRAELAIGHSPLGALSVFALLAFLAAQVATGLFSATLEEFAGPLNTLVSNATGRVLTTYHKSIGEPVLLALVLLHVGAIAYYHVRRGQDLVGPMLHGDKKLAGSPPSSRDDGASRLLAAGLLVLAAGVMAWLVSLGD
jgi:cytochrome b